MATSMGISLLSIRNRPHRSSFFSSAACFLKILQRQVDVADGVRGDDLRRHPPDVLLVVPLDAENLRDPGNQDLFALAGLEILPRQRVQVVDAPVLVDQRFGVLDVPVWVRTI